MTIANLRIELTSTGERRWGFSFRRPGWVMRPSIATRRPTATNVLTNPATLAARLRQGLVSSREAWAELEAIPGFLEALDEADAEGDSEA